MGGGSYSFRERSLRANRELYHSASTDDLFTQNKEKKALPQMESRAIERRESRDSQEHPESFPVIFGMDVTGSMGRVPYKMLQTGIPTIMEDIFQAGIPHPQVLFVGVGDHYADKHPLQIGQFESNDELMDKWLKNLYLEGGGGRGDAESYHLVWLFAANHVVHDSWEKRGQKGVLITVGDEPCHKVLEKDFVAKLFPASPEDWTLEEILHEVSKKWNVFHIHIAETRAGHREETKAFWKGILGDNLRIAESYLEVPKIVAEICNGAYQGKREKIEIDTPYEIL